MPLPDIILRISRIDVILNLLWFRHQFSFRYFFRRSTFNSHKRELCWSRVDSFLGLLGILKMFVQRTKLHKQWSEPWNELQNDFFQNTSKVDDWQHFLFADASFFHVFFQEENPQSKEYNSDISNFVFFSLTLCINDSNTLLLWSLRCKN